MSPRLAFPADVNPAFIARPFQRHTIDGIPPTSPQWTHRMPAVEMLKRDEVRAFHDWQAGDLLEAKAPLPRSVRFFACEVDGCCYWMSADDVLPADERAIEDATQRGCFWRKL